MTLGDRIRSLRGTESRKVFCTRFNISEVTLMRYEKNETNIDIPTLLKIATHYNASIEWLILGNNKTTNSSANNMAPSTQKLILEDVINTDKNLIPASNNSLLEWVCNLESDEFINLWGNYMGDKPAMKGWVQIEMIRRFPEFIEWLKKHNYSNYRTKNTTLINNATIGTNNDKAEN